MNDALTAYDAYRLAEQARERQKAEEQQRVDDATMFILDRIREAAEAGRNTVSISLTSDLTYDNRQELMKRLGKLGYRGMRNGDGLTVDWYEAPPEAAEESR